MIINNVKSDVEVIGNIERNTVTIDPDNIDFIISILSTNLYSYPIDSFIRETVSNAVDSHKEANVSEPVIIELGLDLNNSYYCLIRDTGTGISKERFESIYKKIGSSTKRDSDDYIGAFGIGRFSALSVSDTVFINSCYEGYKYSYIMYKENNKLNIDILSSSPTELPNGVEVKVNIESSEIYDFERAITSQLCYFENVYFETRSLPYFYSTTKERAKEFNNLVIKRFKYFSVNNFKDTSDISLLLGKVRYPLRLNGLNKNYQDYIQKLPISLNFNIGELSITPNREEIIYNSTTIKKIEDTLDLAIEELRSLIPDDNIDIDNIFEYYSKINSPQKYTILENSVKSVIIDISKLKPIKYTFKGKTYSKDLFNDTFKFLYNRDFVISNYKYNGSITGSINSFSIFSILSGNKRVVLCDIASLKNITKDYIRATQVSITYFVKPKDNKAILKEYKSLKKMYVSNYGNSIYFKDVFKNLLECLTNHLKNTYINNSSPTKQFIEERKNKRLSTKTFTKRELGELTIYEITKSLKHGYGINGFIEKAKSITLEPKKNKCLFIYSTKEDHKALYNLCATLHYSKPKITFCRINSLKEKFIKDNPYFINIEDIFKMKHKILKDVITSLYIQDKIPQIKDSNLHYIFKDVSEKYYKELEFIIDFVNNNCDRFYNTNVKDFKISLLKYGIENNLFNLEVKARFELLYPILKKCIFLKDLNFDYSKTYVKQHFITDYLLARKILRPDLKAVKDAKSFINNYLTKKD